MVISEALVALAGFVLAHAAWSVSDLPKFHALVPMVFVQEGEEIFLHRFEADAQQTAIANAKAFIAEKEALVDAWVFAREGLYNEGGVKTDVLSVEAKSSDMDASIVFIQKFQPFASNEFKILGSPIVVFDGEIIENPEELLAILQDGIESHEQVAPLWQGWID